MTKQNIYMGTTKQQQQQQQRKRYRNHQRIWNKQRKPQPNFMRGKKRKFKEKKIRILLSWESKKSNTLCVGVSNITNKFWWPTTHTILQLMQETCSKIFFLFFFSICSFSYFFLLYLSLNVIFFCSYFHSMHEFLVFRNFEMRIESEKKFHIFFSWIYIVVHCEHRWRMMCNNWCFILYISNWWFLSSIIIFGLYYYIIYLVYKYYSKWLEQKPSFIHNDLHEMNESKKIPGWTNKQKQWTGKKRIEFEIGKWNFSQTNKIVEFDIRFHSFKLNDDTHTHTYIHLIWIWLNHLIKFMLMKSSIRQLTSSCFLFLPTNTILSAPL